eukprot:COSAG01_NODE_751_length_13837_cov_78.727981_16_plen_360_part_00
MEAPGQGGGRGAARLRAGDLPASQCAWRDRNAGFGALARAGGAVQPEPVGGGAPLYRVEEAVPLQQLVLEVVTDTAQRAAHFAAKRQWSRERSQLSGSAAAALALDFVEHFPLDRSAHATEMLQLRRRLERRQLLRTPRGGPRGADGDGDGDGDGASTSRARFDRSAVGQRITAAAAAAAAQAATALLRNIVVVGGTADLPGLPRRLAEEVKAAAAAAAGDGGGAGRRRCAASGGWAEPPRLQCRGGRGREGRAPRLRRAAGGLRGRGGGGASRAFPRYTRSILTEICPRHACSCHKIEDGNASGLWAGGLGRGGAGAAWDGGGGGGGGDQRPVAGVAGGRRGERGVGSTVQAGQAAGG